MAVKGCGPVVRVLLLGFSLFRMGICVTGFSVALRLMVTDREDIYNAYTYQHTLLKATLIMILTMSLFGIGIETVVWIGATVETRSWLGLYLLLNLISFLFFLAPIITGGIIAKNAEDAADEQTFVNSTMWVAFQTKDHHRVRDYQETLRCCGWNSYKHWLSRTVTPSTVNNSRTESTTTVNKKTVRVTKTNTTANNSNEKQTPPPAPIPREIDVPRSCCRRSKREKESCVRTASEFYEIGCKQALADFIHRYVTFLTVSMAIYEGMGIANVGVTILFLLKLSTVTRPGKKKGFFEKLTPGGL